MLVLSGVLEAVWASALGASDGFRRPVPVAIFAVTAVLSLLGLAHAMTSLPTGTAYAVWVGIGAAGTIAFGILVHHDPVSPVRLGFLMLLVVSIVGLRATS